MLNQVAQGWGGDPYMPAHQHPAATRLVRPVGAEDGALGTRLSGAAACTEAFGEQRGLASLCRPKAWPVPGCCAGSASIQPMSPCPLQVEELLDCMQPAAVRLDLQTSDFDELKQHGRPSTEPWFDVPFAQCPVPAACLAAWQDAWDSKTPRADMALPPRNEFLPSDFSLRSDNRGSPGQPPANGTAAVNGTGAASDVTTEGAPTGVQA